MPRERKLPEDQRDRDASPEPAAETAPGTEAEAADAAQGIASREQLERLRRRLARRFH